MVKSSFKLLSFCESSWCHILKWYMSHFQILISILHLDDPIRLDLTLFPPGVTAGCPH